MKMHKDNIINKLLKAFNVLFLITNAVRNNRDGNNRDGVIYPNHLRIYNGQSQNAFIIKNILCSGRVYGEKTISY